MRSPMSSSYSFNSNHHEPHSHEGSNLLPPDVASHAKRHCPAPASCGAPTPPPTTPWITSSMVQSAPKQQCCAVQGCVWEASSSQLTHRYQQQQCSAHKRGTLGLASAGSGTIPNKIRWFAHVDNTGWEFTIGAPHIARVSLQANSLVPNVSLVTHSCQDTLKKDILRSLHDIFLRLGEYSCIMFVQRCVC